MEHRSGAGMVEIESAHSVDETVERLRQAIESRGLTIFVLVDHSGEAARVGLAMPPTKLLIFGSPKAGTPLMLAAPSTAIDLPLKLLVREDADEKAWISYNDPEWLRERHGFPAEMAANIAGVVALARAASARS